MLDGRVARNSERRSTRVDFPHVSLISYAAKFASAFLRPFREAAGATPSIPATAIRIDAVANGDEP